MSLKVGVRVRPFNQRENALNCKLCVDMIGNLTRLYDSENTQKHRDFTFDYSFWSHDQFSVDQNGYFLADNDKYSDQNYVFEQVGLQLLKNAWEGYHCCLFAYGQTGAGKSYSMVGYGANKGIVPISCEQIFTRIAKNDNPNKEYEVQISMMEIYNERVQDLLIPISKRPKEGHKIRQHKTLGIYVQGMSKHFVDTYDLIQKKMEEGGRNRSIAATEMNASSSRAHTIISIEFKQTQVGQNNKKRQKLSVIHLVDLAGSEKVGKTGATGDRLKEAAGINKSLSVLGLVISALADKALGKDKNAVVPYRNSCLTRILQNALGGNSKTLMICAISPANDNYEQTLSTLRYADQAKKIQNKAIVNQSQTDKLIRNLTQQKQELRQKLLKMQEMFRKFSITPEMLQAKNETQAELKFIASRNNDYETSKNDKKKLQQEQVDEIQFGKANLERPHLVNLNQDPQLSRKVNYSICRQETKVGKRGFEPPNDIEIGGMGIRKQHCLIKKSQTNENEQQQSQQYYILPVFQTKQESNCYLNGDEIFKQERIYHNDRISFGTNNIFLVIIPNTQARQHIDHIKIDWDYAQNQIYLKKQQIEKTQNQEKEKKLKEETDFILKQKEDELKEILEKLNKTKEMIEKNEFQKNEEKAELQKKIRLEQAMATKKQKQIQLNKKKIIDSETQQKQKSKQKYYYQRKLLKALPKCIELNLIAKQFKKNVSMSVKMILENQEDDDQNFQLKKRTILIKVANRQAGYSYWWDLQTLENRYYIIKDLSQEYFQTGVIPTMHETNDPFWDPRQPTLIGRSFLATKALAFMFDNPVTLPIIGQDEHCGQLIVNLIPTDKTGIRNLCQQFDQELNENDDQLQQTHNTSIKEIAEQNHLKQIQQANELQVALDQKAESPKSFNELPQVQVQEYEEEQPLDYEPALLNKPLYFLVMIQSGKIPLNYKEIYVEYVVKVNEYERLKFKTDNIKQKTHLPIFNYRKLHSFDVATPQLLKYLLTAKIIFKIYGCQIIQEEKKKNTATNNSIQLDVQKAKRQDLLKKNSTPTIPNQSKAGTPVNQQKKDLNKSPIIQKKPGNINKTPQIIYKTNGSTTNNTISQRNKKNAKQKDCEIY